MTREEADLIAAPFANLPAHSEGGDLALCVSDQLMYPEEVCLTSHAIRAISTRILTLTEIAAQNALVSEEA